MNYDVKKKKNFRKTTLRHFLFTGCVIWFSENCKTKYDFSCKIRNHLLNCNTVTHHIIFKTMIKKKQS